jgi:hypothetical protein
MRWEEGDVPRTEHPTAQPEPTNYTQKRKKEMQIAHNKQTKKKTF